MNVKLKVISVYHHARVTVKGFKAPDLHMIDYSDGTGDEAIKHIKILLSNRL